MEKLTNINKYLLLVSDNKNKKLKKKIHKEKLEPFFTVRNVSDEKNTIDTIKNFIVTECNSKNTHSDKLLGILRNENQIANDKNAKNLLLLNVQPKEWDILCLESEIKSYDFENDNNNVFWTKTEILNTGHFVINGKSINKIVKILKNVKNWEELITDFNKLNTFTATHKYITSFRQKVDQLDKLNTESRFHLNHDRLSKPNLEKRPKLSFICPLTDHNKLFYTVMSFLKIDYPNELLELIIVDTKNADKKLKSFIPQDSRIKVITIPNKDNIDVPLDYQLNTGVKYSQGEIIFHLFDTNCYFNYNIKSIIKLLMNSDKKIIASCDSLLENKNELYISKSYSLKNLVYYKQIWQSKVFENDIYNFLNNRWSCIGWISSLYFSFEKNNMSELFDTCKKLPLLSSNFIDTSLKESYKLAFGEL